MLQVDMKRVKELDVRLLQRICLFFCFKLGWTHVQARAALEVVFGNNNLLHPTRSRWWFKAFRSGRTTLVDLQRRHRHKSARTPQNIQAVQRLIDIDKSITFAAIMTQTGLKQSTVHRIVRKDLSLTLRSARLLPNFLTPRHLQERYQHSRHMLNCVHQTPSLLKKIVTMDKAWCYQYDPETKRQASQWLQPSDARPTHPRRSISVKKLMLVAFFDYLGMVHFEFLRGGTVNTATFLSILGRFRESLRIRRPRQIRYLHMDNAPAHGARDTRLHLLLTGQRVIHHPPLSPDLSPCDFWLFGRLKGPLRGRQFPSLDALQTAVTQQIGQIPAQEYHETMLVKWPKRWARCMNANGDYFEGQ